MIIIIISAFYSTFCHIRKSPPVNHPTLWDKDPLESLYVVNGVLTIHQQAAWIYVSLKCRPGSELPRQAWVKVNMLICGDGAYPRVLPATAEQTSRQQITSSPITPLSSTNKWSLWLDWCWCRRSNSWVASQQVPRHLFRLVIWFHSQEKEGPCQLKSNSFNVWCLSTQTIKKKQI